MTVVDWLLDSDPAIRWQVMRDLTDAPAAEVAAERARIAREGWGARILAAQDPDGRWNGGTLLPFWISTAHALQLLYIVRTRPHQRGGSTGHRAGSRGGALGVRREHAILRR